MAAIGTVVHFAQQIVVCSSFAIPYPANFDSVIDNVRIVEFRISVAPKACVTGNGFIVRYLGEILWPLLLAGGFLDLFIFGRIPRMQVERYKRQAIVSSMEFLPDDGLLHLRPTVTSCAAATNACERGWKGEQHTATGVDSRPAV